MRNFKNQNDNKNYILCIIIPIFKEISLNFLIKIIRMYKDWNVSLTNDFSMLVLTKKSFKWDLNKKKILRQMRQTI